MSEAESKKQIEETFSEMQHITNKVSEILKEMNKVAPNQELLNEVIDLQRNWSEIAKKYVSASREYHDLYHKKKA